MDSMYLLIFLMFCVGLAAWLLFLWAVKSGQYDDVEGPKYRMLDNDDDKKEFKPTTEKTSQAPATESGKENQKS